MTFVAVSANQRSQHMWRQNLWECTTGCARKTDPRYLLVNLYQTIPVWLWKMVVRQCLSWEVHSCILFERAARGSRFSNKADILTEVMHLYSTEGLTCYWRIRDDKSCIVKYLM